MAAPAAHHLNPHHYVHPHGQTNGQPQPGIPAAGEGGGGVVADAAGDDHEHEYTHSYYPLETRELTTNEQNFIRAAQEGQLDHCASYLNNGLVDVDVQDQWGSTALMHAVNKRHTSLVLMLLSKGANIDKQDYRGITCLMEASWNRHIDMVKLLLKNGANINLTDERDYTALMQAAEEGHHQVVQLLIEAGADLNKQEKKRNYTALMWSVVEGHPAVVQYLVGAGADLNIQDKYGFTALMQAARTRFLAAVLVLVGTGADLDIKDKKNRTVYDLGNQQVLQAIEKGKRELKRKYLAAFAQEKGLAQLHPDTINIIANYLVITQ